MAPKAKRQSKSPKTKKGGHKAEAVAAEVAAAFPPKIIIEEPKEVYRGPRPDQEMLRVVHTEAVDGNAASIEDIYGLIWKGEEDVNQRNYSGFSPLHVAAARGDAELVALLLERGADVAIPSVDKGEIPLHHAARYGHTLVVHQLVPATFAAGLVDKPNNTGFTPLMLGAAAGDAQILKLLLRSRADPSARNALHGGVTALHAAIHSGSADTAELLLDFDAPVDDADQRGRSPLFGAAITCNPQCVSLLLRSKADANKVDQSGMTALDCVPMDFPEAPDARERVVKLLKAYQRPDPTGRRHDARFDRRDGGEAEFV